MTAKLVIFHRAEVKMDPPHLSDQSPEKRVRIVGSELVENYTVSFMLLFGSAVQCIIMFMMTICECNKLKLCMLFVLLDLSI